MLATALLILATPQAFGRFGYEGERTHGGFELGRTGFRAEHPQAERFEWLKPSGFWSPLAVSEYGQTVGLQAGLRQPTKLAMDLLSPGFLLYFPAGIGLRVGSTGSPYVTWANGSASAGVPTPESPWIAVSFRSEQPPIVLGFVGAPRSLVVRGKPGDYTIQSVDTTAGWVRVALPLGLRGLGTGTAASLGQLARAAASGATAWSAPANRLVARKIAPEPRGLRVTWTFQSPGAMLPRPLQPGAVPGVRLDSPARALPWNLKEGPVWVADGPRVEAFFTQRAALPMRAATLGPMPVLPTRTGVGHLAERALAELSAAWPDEQRSASRTQVETYIATASLFREPWTGQSLPYDAKGLGYDVLAAHALLLESFATAAGNPGENALFDSLAWRTDWRDWMPAGIAGDVGERGAALGAVAGALSLSPERRLQGAMLEAGLTLREIEAKRDRRPFLDVWPDVRAALYRTDDMPWARAVFGNTIRLDAPFLPIFADPGGFRLEGSGEASVALSPEMRRALRGSPGVRRTATGFSAEGTWRALFAANVPTTPSVPAYRENRIPGR